VNNQATTDGVLSEGEAMQANPFDKVVLIALTIRIQLGASKKLKVVKEGYGESCESITTTTDTDTSMVRANKKILDSPEYEAIGSAANQIRTFLYGKMVPGGQKIFKSGTYPIPIAILDSVDEALKEKVDYFNLAVQKFLEVYELRKEEAKQRLKDLADESDYPPLEKVKNAFGVTYNFISFGPPQSLEGFSKDLYQREVAKIKESCAEASVEMQQTLRTLFSDLISHMVERLKPGPDGKKKIFKDTLISNAKEFFADFQARNIFNDTELEGLVNRCRNILAGRDAETLRKNNNVREVTAAALEKIKLTVDEMITSAPVRKIVLD